MLEETEKINLAKGHTLITIARKGTQLVRKVLIYLVKMLTHGLLTRKLEMGFFSIND